MRAPQIQSPVAIVGAGISGREAKRLCEALGVGPVTTLDDKPGKGEYSDPVVFLRDFRPRTLVVSPGVPLAKAWIRDFESSGGVVTSELELALDCLEQEKIVAVTGSVGKSTVVSLLGEGAKRFCPDVFIGGNLGTPLATYAADVVSGKRRRSEWLVLELSSYQLERARNLRPEVAVITSLLQNHMERYPRLEAYYETKWELARSARRGAVLNANGGDLRAFAEKRVGALAAPVEWTSEKTAGLDFSRARLVGAHNRDNLALAVAAARLAGWPKTAEAGFLAFAGLSHRIQDAGTHAGVRFVNDSKATTVESVLTAVGAVEESLSGAQTLWLLAGGRDKGLPWPKLGELRAKSAVRTLFFGECGELARRDSKIEGDFFPRLEPALRALKSRAKAGDVVLLSPGGSSLDEFKNFEERGEVFMRLAREIFGGS